MIVTERVLLIGGLLILAAAAFGVAYLPALTMSYNTPSAIARPYTPVEIEGRHIYMSNGCTYCHSQFIRPQDWDLSAIRVSQTGDYAYDTPHLLGSERTGPDLSQEGGIRSEDWHRAHFYNPRYTRPASLMPQFRFLTEAELSTLIAYVQSLGHKMADARVVRLNVWRKALQQAYASGTDANFAYLHTLVPPQWRTMPNPYPADAEALARGRFVYEQSCVGCHGDFGDGNGPAARFMNPRPANFTTLRRIGASGGLLYYQIMNGITGTAMMSFKRELESAKIWDVSNYVAVNFIGQSDGNTAPRGEDEVLEPVDPNAPPPPPPASVTTPPPTSPALQPEVNAARGGVAPGSGAVPPGAGAAPTGGPPPSSGAQPGGLKPPAGGKSPGGP